MANSYDIGDIVRLFGNFTSTNSTVLDPTRVTITYWDPTGAGSTFTSTGGLIVNPSSGYYFLDVVPTLPGVWPYRIDSTGTGQTAQESYFRVFHPISERNST